MKLQRVFISGRVEGKPTANANPATGDGELIVLSVEEGGKSHLWSAFLQAGDKMSGRLAEGDAVAVVGLMNEDRRAAKGVRGPIMVEALLALRPGGEYFCGLTSLG